MRASTREELKHKKDPSLKKLNDSSITINKYKCELNSDNIVYLISEDGIFHDKKLTKKRKEMSTPRNKTKLDSFLAKTNFYSKYLPR